MNFDLLCGAELPLGPNPYLQSFDEESGSIDLWKDTIEGTFRYSFVPALNFSDRNTEAIFKQIGYLNLAWCQWVVGWRFCGSGPGWIRSRAIRTALEKSGWSVLAKEGIGLAACQVSSQSMPIVLPDICRRDLTGFFVFLGRSISLEDLADSPLKETIRHFCWTQRLEPSLKFIQHLAALGTAVAYLSTSSDVRSGVVFAGSAALAPNLMDIQLDGKISRVFWNEEAPLVWRT